MTIPTLTVRTPPWYATCSVYMLCLFCWNKMMCQQFPRLRYVSPCGLNLCPFSALVCDLLTKWLFHGSPKARCRRVSQSQSWRRTLGLLGAFPTPSCRAPHGHDQISGGFFFSQFIFSPCRLAAAASRHFSDLRRYRDTTIGSVAILGEFPPNSRELLPNSIAKFFASSPRWARVLHLRLSTSGTWKINLTSCACQVDLSPSPPAGPFQISWQVTAYQVNLSSQLERWPP